MAATRGHVGVGCLRVPGRSGPSGRVALDAGRARGRAAGEVASLGGGVPGSLGAGGACGRVGAGWDRVRAPLSPGTWPVALSGRPVSSGVYNKF